MPTPFPFTAGAVLTAAQLNSISELPTRTITSNDSAVAADAYKRIILNGTSITYTINTSTFTTGQVVEIYNANSTVATIAAGAGITLNGATVLTLEQYQTAELYATSATTFVLWPSNTRAGLELIKSQTIGSAVSTVTVSDVFSSTYDNYRITIIGGVGSTVESLLMTLGSANTSYYWGGGYSRFDAGAAAALAGNNTSSWRIGGYSTSNINAVLDVTSPNLAKTTGYSTEWADHTSAAGAAGAWANGFQNSTTQFTAFTITANGGNLTGGTIRVYGYRN